MKFLIPLLLALSLLACAPPPPAGPSLQWSEDLPAAEAEARQSNRWLLMNFSGSDWCGWCIKLDREVFSQPAFQAYAAENLVPVLIDFPRRKSQPDDLKARNETLMRRFQVRGFPTLLLFTPEGELAGQLGYVPGGPEAFIQAIRQAQARHQMRPANPPSAG